MVAIGSGQSLRVLRGGGWVEILGRWWDSKPGFALTWLNEGVGGLCTVLLCGLRWSEAFRR